MLWKFWLLTRPAVLVGAFHCHLPQPNTGIPGTGGLTFMFLGDAGVAGRADILQDSAERCARLETEAELK